MNESEWAEGVAVLVKGYVGNAMDAITRQLAELTARVGQIPAGKDGTSVTVEQILPPLVETIAKAATDAAQRAVDAMPKPADGTSVSIDDVHSLVAAEVFKAVVAIEEDREEFYATLIAGLTSEPA